MYGLKQSPRAWYAKIDGFFYHYVLFDASMILMYIWSWFMVLWLLFSCMWMTFWLQEAQRMNLPPWRMQWTMHFLWLIWGYWANSWVSRLLKPNRIKLHQSKYALYLLNKFNMKYCKRSKTPFLSGVKLEEAGSSPMVNNTLYR